ncbi:MAG TPA: hypothetical protein DDW90_09500 [Cyanobacteria bacterium UBA9971]|nr:hypothetical protein [Cyanobacteria bacterium UBA9971]
MAGKIIMKINSGNSTAFGCGACVGLKRITAPVPESYQFYQKAIKCTQKEEGITHGQAASKVFKTISNFLKRL